MKLKGTEFQLKVWSYLRKIPRGTVKTYSQVAKDIGKPLAVRAVANAIGCHVTNLPITRDAIISAINAED